MLALLRRSFMRWRVSSPMDGPMSAFITCRRAGGRPQEQAGAGPAQRPGHASWAGWTKGGLSGRECRGSGILACTASAAPAGDRWGRRRAGACLSAWACFRLREPDCKLNQSSKQSLLPTSAGPRKSAWRWPHPRPARPARTRWPLRSTPAAASQGRTLLPL